MSGGDRTAAGRDSARERQRDERGLVRGRDLATDGGTGHHSPEDKSDRSPEESRDRVAGTADPDPPSGPSRDAASETGRTPTSETNHDPASGPHPDGPPEPNRDGPSEPNRDEPSGAADERPFSERSRQRLEDEIAALEQNPEQYETRDQAVIDRYEGLLAERRYRQREAECDRESGYRQRLRWLKNRALRTVGLR